MNGSTGERRVTSATYWDVWGKHVAIAAAYAGFYELCRYVSVPQWMLMSGFRLTCLLLLPTRYWPAVVMGEALPLLENALIWEHRFGLLWAGMAAVPMALMWMPALGWLRNRWPIQDADGHPRMMAILSANLVTSIITAVATTVVLVVSLRYRPGDWPEVDPEDYVFPYLLGAYLGALTVTPAVLAFYGRFRALGDRPLSVGLVWRSPLLRDMLWWVLPSLALLAWAASMAPNDILRQAARFAMLVPILGMGWRHSWHGTATAGMAASAAMAMTATAFLDSQMIQAQVTLALTLSGALLLGSRTRNTRALKPGRS
ncbi:MASE1 domain-containing protein [Luteibacter sp. CQ10]|uniref:MASE1 domain-containing protein n=1 Tax=Luteibacter sp. CQ10 TaxID=2805821 RepID=UPI0034A5AC9E